VINFGFQGIKAHYEDLIPNALISATINKLALEHHSNWSSKLIKTLDVWKKPNSPYLKINYDITIRDFFLAQAFVCRNSSGTIIKCISLISPPCTALRGEALTALLTAHLALLLMLLLLS
jgi:hypothetical protein